MKLWFRPGLKAGFWVYVEDAGNLYLLFAKTTFGKTNFKLQECHSTFDVAMMKSCRGFDMNKVIGKLKKSQILADPFAFTANKQGEEEVVICSLKDVQKRPAAKPKARRAGK